MDISMDISMDLSMDIHIHGKPANYACVIQSQANLHNVVDAWSVLLRQMYWLAKVLLGPGTSGGERAQCLELWAVWQSVHDRSASLLIVQQPHPWTALWRRPDKPHRLPRHLQVHTAMCVDHVRFLNYQLANIYYRPYEARPPISHHVLRMSTISRNARWVVALDMT